MESLVIDSDVIVAAFLNWEPHHQQGREIIAGLENGEYDFHLPMLVIVEVASAIRRRSGQSWVSMLAVWKQNVLDWERDGKFVLYPLDRSRMEISMSVAQRYRLRGSDSVIAALAEELSISLQTFDNEIIDRFPPASP